MKFFSKFWITTLLFYSLRAIFCNDEILIKDNELSEQLDTNFTDKIIYEDNYETAINRTKKGKETTETVTTKKPKQKGSKVKKVMTIMSKAITAADKIDKAIDNTIVIMDKTSKLVTKGKDTFNKIFGKEDATEKVEDEIVDNVLDDVIEDVIDDEESGQSRKISDDDEFNEDNQGNDEDSDEDSTSWRRQYDRKNRKLFDENNAHQSGFGLNLWLILFELLLLRLVIHFC